MVFNWLSFSRVFFVHVFRTSPLRESGGQVIGKLVTLPDQGDVVGLIIGKLSKNLHSDESRDAWEVLYSGEDGDYFFESEMVEVQDGHTNQ